MQATAVNPPATAEATPVATVSLCSCPGSRRCTCMSIRPGHTTNPAGTSITCAPFTGMSFAMRAMRSPSIRMSKTPSRPFAGSTMRPPLSSRFMFRSAREEIEHRHTDRHTVGNLLENDRVRTVGDLRGDFDAAVHRSGMHDDDVGFGAPQPLPGHAEYREVLAQRRKKRALHP